MQGSPDHWKISKLMRLHGVVLNLLSTGITLSLYHYGFKNYLWEEVIKLTFQESEKLQMCNVKGEKWSCNSS
jgi:hypothetical protein